MKTQTKTNVKSPEDMLNLVALLQEKIKSHEATIFQKNTLINDLEFRLSIALRHRFAKRAEKLDGDSPQLHLFSEADINETDTDNTTSEEQESITVPAHQRKKSGRKLLPKDLPRDRREYDLSEKEKQCDCGSEMTAFGEEISEQLEIIPAHMYVIQHVKKKYACKACESGVKQAKAPLQPIPKSNAGPGLLAHIIISKFCDHLPLYRQENILKRCGIDISRATLCQWVNRCSLLLAPLVEQMQKEMNRYDVAYADETVLQVLKEPGREPSQKSYMWLFGGGPPEKFAWIYQYHPGRHGKFAKQFFEHFRGYLHVDGYAGYHELLLHDIKLVGCFAHARRKFFEVAQSAKKKKGLAHAAINQIASLYAIEKQIKKEGLSADAIKQCRQQQSKPILENFKKWCDEKINKVPPRSPIAKAIGYTLKQWSQLTQFIEDGRLEIDNNRTERAIKPFVIGRKNWLFNDSVKGANAGAILYSLIETCKEHKLEPYAYLRYVLKRIVTATTSEDIQKLLPYRCNPSDVLNELNNDRNALGKFALTE